MVQTLLNPGALHPKVINGKEVTCKKFVEIIKARAIRRRGVSRLFKEYAKIFNEHGALEPRNVLNTHVNLVSGEHMIEAKNFYCKSMERVIL